MAFRGQSAVEFLSVYGYVFLILGIVIAVAFLYSSVPSSIVPFQCNFYSGFQCTDAAIIYNSVSGVSSLVIVASMTQPGVVNVSSFNAVIQLSPTTKGYCLPQTAIAGQYVYCIANLTYTPTQSQIYSGTFTMLANYCAGFGTNVSSTPCSASTNYTFSGSYRVQPQPRTTTLNGIIALSPFTVNYVPITIVNTQNAAEPNPFQLMVQFQPSNAIYKKYERSDLGNIRFFYNNNPIPSWCEKNCSTSNTYNALFWVRVPATIPINSISNTVIKMYFFANTVDYDGVFAGENPNLTSAYGQYDNGQNVFINYWNFAGSGLPSGWSGYNAIVSNGLTVNSVVTSGALAYASTNAIYGNNPNQILDFYGRIEPSSGPSGIIGYAVNMSGYPGNPPPPVVGTGVAFTDNGPGSQNWLCGWWNTYSGLANVMVTCTTGISGTSTGLSTNAVYEIYYGSPTQIAFWANYGHALGSGAGSYSGQIEGTSSLPWVTTVLSGNLLSQPQGALPITVATLGDNIQAASVGPISWIRLRAYPSNNVMPLTQFGNVVTAT